MSLQENLVFVMFVASQQFSNGRTESSVVVPDRSLAKVASSLQYFLSRDGDSKSEALNSDVKCGVSNTAPNSNARIVGGEEAKAHSWPWIASLRFKSCDWCQECGATLLYTYWVVTAAHCVYKTKAKKVRVVLGEHNELKKELTEKTFWISEIIIHENYNETSSDNDIALLRLKRPVIFNRYMRPICLPTVDVEEDTKCIVAGWGDTQAYGFATVLNQVTVPILSSELCNTSDWYHGAITDNMICAGYAEGRKDACKGDSGGPMVCPPAAVGGGGWTLDGIVSWGEGCARRMTPGVYTRVVNYLDWIKEKTESLYSDD